MELWDPIGVAQRADAAGEYDSYLWQIWRELHTGSTYKLARKLHEIGSESLGLARPMAVDVQSARELFDWWTAYQLQLKGHS
ncbi:MAG: hypothetical protein ACKVUT_01390 [Gaiella sp.]